MKTLVIATTRPETCLLIRLSLFIPTMKDIHIWLGKHAINPANGDPSPIMADSYIDSEFWNSSRSVHQHMNPKTILLLAKNTIWQCQSVRNDDGM